MKIHNVRLGHATNSSSSHSIIFDPVSKATDDYDDFGWSFFTLASKEAKEELKQFLRWLRKSPERSFRFKDVPVVYADVLNKFVATKDYDSARWYAERYLA